MSGGACGPHPYRHTKTVSDHLCGPAGRAGDLFVGVGNSARTRIDHFYQDEPTNKGDDDDKGVDAFGVSTPIAFVRAERDGGGDGRAYEIHFTAFGSFTCHGNPQRTGERIEAAVDSGIRIDCKAWHTAAVEVALTPQ